MASRRASNRITYNSRGVGYTSRGQRMRGPANTTYEFRNGRNRLVGTGGTGGAGGRQP